MNSVDSRNQVTNYNISNVPTLEQSLLIQATMDVHLGKNARKNQNT